MASQGVAALLSVLYLMKGDDVCRLDWRRIRIDRGVLGQVLRIGVPAGLQSMVITLSNVIIQWAINGFGVDAIAAFSAYFKLELLIYLPIVAFGQAMMTFSGQNIGAGRFDRVRLGVRAAITMGVAYAAVSAALLLLFGGQSFALFNKDAAVIACGVRIIRVTFPFYWIYAILEVLADTIRGAGRSLPPMAIILVCLCVLRTALLLLFLNRFGTLESVAAVYPCAWVAASAALAVYWRRMCRENRTA
jgi:Na+-driven multidrug efflux pump